MPRYVPRSFVASAEGSEGRERMLAVPQGHVDSRLDCVPAAGYVANDLDAEPITWVRRMSGDVPNATNSVEALSLLM